MYLTEIIEFILHSEFIGGIVGVLISAIVLYKLGIRAYRKQKSIEECRLNYIDQGIEALKQELVESQSTFRWNWGRALTLLKHVRDWKKGGFQVKPEDIADNFITYRPKSLGLNSFDKVEELLDDDIATKWFLVALTDLNLASFFFTLDLAVFVKKFLEDPEKSPADGKTFSERYFEELEKHSNTQHRHYNLTECLGKLSRRIRFMQISYEDLPKVKGDEEVKEIVKKMNDDFKVIEKEDKAKKI